MAGADVPRLCVFTRAPVRGRVKRRLARELGEAQALEAHRTLVEDTLDRVCGRTGWSVELWLAGEPDATVGRWVRRYDVSLHQQSGSDLGGRMCHAMARALARSERAVLIGTDCPRIDASYVAEGLDRLNAADMVMGPAEDGGYGLIGARELNRSQLDDVFAHVPWGTSDVAAMTRQHAADAGLSLVELPLIWDVDDLTGWQRYVSLRGAGSPPDPD